MSSLATAPLVSQAVAIEAMQGLTAHPKTLSPWLFYDETGSQLFESITTLPEYYLTRTERSILDAHADEIIARAAAGHHPLTLLELGAGTASKTGLLLAAAVRRQGTVLYQPIDVSESALHEARTHIESRIPGVAVSPQVANYTTDPLFLDRPSGVRALALYIGSSIGNFSPDEARDILRNLRALLVPGDSLLLGTDLGIGPSKDERTLLAAYDDAAGVTAAFNRNLLHRLNLELGTDFRPDCFAHKAVWNPAASRIEMHLVSLVDQRVHLPSSPAGSARAIVFRVGETIHTESSYKFTAASLDALLRDSGFTTTATWHDPEVLFAVTLARAD